VICRSEEAVEAGFADSRHPFGRSTRLRARSGVIRNWRRPQTTLPRSVTGGPNRGGLGCAALPVSSAVCASASSDTAAVARIILRSLGFLLE